MNSTISVDTNMLHVTAGTDRRTQNCSTCTVRKAAFLIFTSAVRRTLSARYGGADPLRHRNINQSINQFYLLNKIQ